MFEIYQITLSFFHRIKKIGLSLVDEVKQAIASLNDCGFQIREALFHLPSAQRAIQIPLFFSSPHAASKAPSFASTMVCLPQIGPWKIKFGTDDGGGGIGRLGRSCEQAER